MLKISWNRCINNDKVFRIAGQVPELLKTIIEAAVNLFWAFYEIRKLRNSEGGVD